MLSIRQDFLSIYVHARCAEVMQQTEYEPRRAAMAIVDSGGSLRSLPVLAREMSEEHDRRYDSQR